jgi:predicted Zn-dependent peptidase
VVGRTGFAHFFEHLMFEGSDNIPRGEYDKITLSAGGTLNANTSQDRTFYYELLPSNQLELGLWLESERLLHLRIDSIGVETQRAVVKEERKQSYDNRPYGSIIEETMSHAYKVHPYRWTPSVSRKTSTAPRCRSSWTSTAPIMYPTMQPFHCRRYDIEQCKKLVEKYFGEIPGVPKS